METKQQYCFIVGEDQVHCWAFKGNGRCRQVKDMELVNPDLIQKAENANMTSSYFKMLIVYVRPYRKEVITLKLVYAGRYYSYKAPSRLCWMVGYRFSPDKRYGENAERLVRGKF